MNEIQMEFLGNRICEKLGSLVHRFEYDGDFYVRRYGEPDTKSLPRYKWRSPDVVIFRDVADFPSFFTELEDDEDWLPAWAISVPIVNIYIVDTTDSDELETHMVEESMIREPPEGLLPCFVLVDDDKAFWSKDSDYFNGNVVVQEKNDAIEIIERLVPQIDSHLRNHQINDPEDSELLHDIAHFLGSELFHFDEVFSAYKNKRYGILVVLLNVYFESHLREVIARKYPTAGIGKKVKNGGHVNFGNMVDFCRARNEITDDEQDLLHSIRTERNTYAHEIESYHFHDYSNTRRTGILSSAIKLYDDWNELGVDIIG